MKKIFKLCIYFSFFILFLLIFLPKEFIYNSLEKELLKQSIIISDEKRDENLLSLRVSDAKVYYQGIEAANIDNLSFFSLLLYSKVEVNDIKLLQSLSSFFPPYIKSIIITHSILDYKYINVSSSGAFGLLRGKIDLLNRVLILKLEASSKMKKQYRKVLSQMKLIEGKYVYEYRF
jgi:hypothetical protein